MSFRIELNKQFKEALNLMENSSRNVFITGKAGTGKSTLLDYFCRHTSKRVAMLAPTGVAAVNISGQTIHSFFGFKPNVTVSEARSRARKTKRDKLFKKLQAIVIDEISMVRADLLDCVDVFLKTVLKNQQPFGGMQMIFFGDLYQLPPIVRGEDKKFFRKEYKSQYFFDAKVMQDFELEVIEMEKIYRQKDKNFIELLNSIRNNSVTVDQIKQLNQRFMPNCGSAKQGYIYLTTTNKLADNINELNLSRLPHKLYTFDAEIEGDLSPKYFPTDIQLKLKKGAQIMLLNNDKKGRWINGTTGKIVKIERDKICARLLNGNRVWISPYSWEVYKLYYDESLGSIAKRVVGSFTQYPIRLAWAITIHKSQGKTFDKAIIDIGRGTFCHGQMYVGLSRCRSLEGIILKKKIKKSNIFMDWRVVKFLTQHQYSLAEKNYPLEQKIEIIKKAIENGTKLRIVYLKANDQRSKRTILPKEVGQMEYIHVKYLGLRAYCFLRKDERIFRVDRILKLGSSPKCVGKLEV